MKSPYPRVLSLDKAREILRTRSQMPVATSDHLAELWHKQPKFNRKAWAAEAGVDKSVVYRKLQMLDEANVLAAGSGGQGDNREHESLSGPQLLAMIDTQLREADEQGRSRDFQVLLSARQSIADASSEVAAASLDPMRICGPKGLRAMPQRIIAVIEVIKPHMEARYPDLYQYLCEFGK